MAPLLSKLGARRSSQASNPVDQARRLAQSTQAQVEKASTESGLRRLVNLKLDPGVYGLSGLTAYVGMLGAAASAPVGLTIVSVAAGSLLTWGGVRAAAALQGRNARFTGTVTEPELHDLTYGFAKGGPLERAVIAEVARTTLADPSRKFTPEARAALEDLVDQAQGLPPEIAAQGPLLLGILQTFEETAVETEAGAKKFAAAFSALPPALQEGIGPHFFGELFDGRKPKRKLEPQAIEVLYDLLAPQAAAEQRLETLLAEVDWSMSKKSRMGRKLDLTEVKRIVAALEAMPDDELATAQAAVRKAVFKPNGSPRQEIPDPSAEAMLREALDRSPTPAPTDGEDGQRPDAAQIIG
jgi:hypothetical protein